MKAETAYQVIQALTSNEVSRLYRMLGVSKKSIKKSKKSSQKLITDAEATEYLLKKFHSKLNE